MKTIEVSEHVRLLSSVGLLYFGAIALLVLLNAKLDQFVYIGPYLVYLITLELSLRNRDTTVVKELKNWSSFILMSIFMCFHNVVILKYSSYEFVSYGYVIVMQFGFVLLAGCTANWFKYIRDKKVKK